MADEERDPTRGAPQDRITPAQPAEVAVQGRQKGGPETPALGSEPPHRARRKIADHPHLWTIALSGLALAVSGISCWQSREALESTEAVAQAALQATGMRLPRRPEDMSFLQVDLTLTNYGQRTARDVVTSFEWEVEQIAVPASWPTYEQPPHPDVAPKNTVTVRVQANRGFYGGRGRSGSDGLRDQRNKLLVYGFTRYTDALRGTQHQDVWCFQYDPADSAQASSLVMRICTYQPTPSRRGE